MRKHTSSLTVLSQAKHIKRVYWKLVMQAQTYMLAMAMPPAVPKPPARRRLAMFEPAAPWRCASCTAIPAAAADPAMLLLGPPVACCAEGRARHGSAAAVAAAAAAAPTCAAPTGPARDIGFAVNAPSEGAAVGALNGSCGVPAVGAGLQQRIWQQAQVAKQPLHG
jgi:hypothetical protein